MSYKQKKKRDDIRKRVELEAHYMIDNDATVRDTASYSGWSKSTVHVDVTDRLLELASTEGTYYSILFNKCQKILERHKFIR